MFFSHAKKDLNLPKNRTPLLRYSDRFISVDTHNQIALVGLTDFQHAAPTAMKLPCETPMVRVVNLRFASQ